MQTVLRFLAALFVFSLAAQPSLLAQQRLDEYNYLVGRDYNQAIQEFGEKGYHLVTHHPGENLASYEYFWSPNDKRCICAKVQYDQVAGVTKANPVDCNQKGSNVGTGIAVAAGAAALLGGIIALTNKSHHHDDNQHHEDERLEAAFERGYRDGVHHARYDNVYRDREEADEYSKGYNAGQKQRTYNLQHHQGNAGGRNRAHVYVSDLVGARASGGLEELERRGFEPLGYRESNWGKQTYYYNDRSQDCLLITVSNGRIAQINNAGNWCR